MNQAATVQAAKGPLVWLDMDQKALDDAYDQVVYAPNRDQVHKRNAFNSDRVRARLGAPKRIAYGSKQMEALDLFPTDKPNAPVNVFIHGGAWRKRWAKDYAFLAEPFVRALVGAEGHDLHLGAHLLDEIAQHIPVANGSAGPGRLGQTWCQHQHAHRAIAPGGPGGQEEREERGTEGNCRGSPCGCPGDGTRLPMLPTPRTAQRREPGSRS